MPDYYTVAENRGLPPLLTTNSLKEAHRFQARQWDEGKVVFVFKGEPEIGTPFYVPKILPKNIGAFSVYWASPERSNSPEIVLDKNWKAAKLQIQSRTGCRINAIWNVTEWYLAGYTEDSDYPDIWKGNGVTYMPPLMPRELMPDLTKTPDGKMAIKVRAILNGNLGTYYIPEDRLHDFTGRIVTG